MPPKQAEQRNRSKSPDNKHGKIGEKKKDDNKQQHGRKNSDDESKVDKLKDKMAGMMGKDKDDKKDDKNRKGREKSRSRSRERKGSRERKQQGKSKSPERKGGPGSKSPGRKGDKSPERKGTGQGQGQQQQPMKMGAAGAAGAGAGAAGGAAAMKASGGRSNSPERGGGPNQQGRPGQGQGPGHGQGQKQHHGPGPTAQQKARTKRGLCWPTENKKDDPSRFIRPGSKVSWYYNWSPHATQKIPSQTGGGGGQGEGLQWIPMTWNASPGIKTLPQEVQKAASATLLTFNEPELPDQANMPADRAAEAWLTHIEPLRKKGVRCGSPGMSSSPQAVGWMQDFRGRIKQQGSDVDFWCFHWYGADLGPFYDYIWSTHHQLDPTKKVWITEFAATNWSKENPLPKEHVENFAREAFKYLDGLDWVERYCWFAPTNAKGVGNVGRWAAMYNEEGNLTEVGKMFRDS